jgi:hypothetical protein
LGKIVFGFLTQALHVIGGDFHSLSILLGLASFGFAIGCAEFTVGQNLRQRAVEPDLVGAPAPRRLAPAAAGHSGDYELVGTAASPRSNPYGRLSLRPPQELLLNRGDRR